MPKRKRDKFDGFDFFRFPSIPHLLWLGEKNGAREDKVLSPFQVSDLLSGGVVVEEKLDGANVGISISSDREIMIQNRGQYLGFPYSGQFYRLNAWLAQHESGLLDVLQSNLILFGEWCAARHSLSYDALPDWFLMFDVYDRGAGMFWDTDRRNALAKQIGLFVVPQIFCGHITLNGLTQLVLNEHSRYRSGKPLEGVVVRHEAGGWTTGRAKLVRPDFVQSIDAHWRTRAIEWNRIDWKWQENRFS